MEYAVKLLPLLFLLQACDPPEVEVAGRQDRELYLGALKGSSTEPEERFDLCDRVRDPNTRGDCFLSVAIDSSRRTHKPAEEYCPRVPRGFWRSECFFMAAETARRQRDPERAALLCQQAGQYHNDCGQHLWQTSVRELIHAAGPEAFASRLPEAKALYLSWEPLLKEETDFEDRFWRRFYQNGFEPRDPLDPALCDPLPSEHRERCRQAAVDLYGRRLLMGLQPPGMPERFCASVRDQASAFEELGAVARLQATADPSFDQAVLRLRQERCP